MYSGHTVLRANSIIANILQGEQEIVLLASILIVMVQDVPRVDNAPPSMTKHVRNGRLWKGCRWCRLCC